MGEISIAVRGVDLHTWKEFQKAIIDRHGNLYGNLGMEVTKAFHYWLNQYNTYAKSRKPLVGSVSTARRDAALSLGGEATTYEVRAFLVDKFGKFEHDISTAMSDLANNGAPSSR
jgi:hypothetical protein